MSPLRRVEDRPLEYIHPLNFWHLRLREVSHRRKQERTLVYILLSSGQIR